MIPSDIRLYSWVDVEEVLLRASEENDWPEYLVWAQSYWEGLSLGVYPKRKENVAGWLESKFEPRLKKEDDNLSIILESVPEKERLLRVTIEETDEQYSKPRFIPSLARPALIVSPVGKKHPKPLDSDLPPVVAFHSFKGGVGRTVHALALAEAITKKKDDSRILLVDGDLEAPGLTWLLKSRIPTPSISYIDFLTLVHGDPDPSASDSIELAVNRIRDIFLDGMYILPAFRSVSQFASLEIKPEHLIQGAEDPFVLTNVLAKLGKALKAQAVIVDLRAGFSELSTGLLLDPRVYRIFLTTLSSQSIDGTCELLKIIGNASPSVHENEPLPVLIISQVPKDLRNSPQLNSFETKILEAAKYLAGDGEKERPVEDTTNAPIEIITDFDQNLIVLSESWRDVLDKLTQTGLVEQMSLQMNFWLPDVYLNSGTVPVVQWNADQLRAERDGIANFTKELIYAETGNVKEFLTISPLRNLVTDFGTKVPIAIIVGAKGAGKTYTSLQVLQRGTWEDFCHDAGLAKIDVNALICPVLYSKNLKENAQSMVSAARSKAAKALSLDQTLRLHEINDYLRKSLRENLHEGQWRDRWLNVIAWSMGFEPKKLSAGKNLVNELRNRKKFVLAVFDGLEDLFQDLSSEKNQQVALRSLLQDVPDWLEQQPLRPLGLLVFVRQDMVLNAVKQNSAQLMAKYEPYALKWNSDEALRLIAWTSRKAGTSLKIEVDALSQANKNDLMNMLVPLWGKKLGHDRSKEGRSADWVAAALSDFNGQIQARDLVRLLYESAKGSKPDSRWNDRLLVPTAIRNAVRTCSEEKIKEIKIENPTLGKIFDKLSTFTGEAKQIPFSRDQLGLEPNEVNTLETNGVLFRDGEEYYMPEIYRLALGFRLKAGARPRVISLSRRVRR